MRLIKYYIFTIFLLSINISFAQSIFIVHAHKHYILDNYNSFLDNSFSAELEKLNEYYCQNRDVNKFWVFDKRKDYGSTKYPIKRCGAKKLISPMGQISGNDYKYNVSNSIILAGIYLDNCVLRTYRSVRFRFLNNINSNDNILNIHIPLSATISEKNDNPKVEFSDNDSFLQVHEIGSYNINEYSNLHLVRSYKSEVPDAKTINIHFWSDVDTFIEFQDSEFNNE